VARTEAAVVRRYQRELYNNNEQDDVRQALHAYVEAKADVARSPQPATPAACEN
jgi:hypothetical protein